MLIGFGYYLAQNAHNNVVRLEEDVFLKHLEVLNTYFTNNYDLLVQLCTSLHKFD